MFVKKLKRRRIYEKQYLFTSARHVEKILDISFKKFQKYCHFRLTTNFLFDIIMMQGNKASLETVSEGS